MKKLDLSQVLGHPLSMDDFRHLQEGLKEAISAVAISLGETSFILTGCVVTIAAGNASVTQGYIYHDGEVYKVAAHSIPEVIGGTLSYKVKEIVNTPSPVIYKSGNPVNVHIEHQLELTYNVGLIVVNDISYQSNAPKGGIIMYDGSVANFDVTGLGLSGKGLKGWALCNGQNGTPDLRGRFIAGYNPLDGDYDAIGKNGGSKTHILLNANLPAHNHPVTDNGHSHGVNDPGHAHSIKSAFNGADASYVLDGATGLDGANNNGYVQPAQTGVTVQNGGTGISVDNNAAHQSQPVEHRSPYYVLAYIKRIA